MHVPDGFLHDPASVATAVVAGGVVAVAARRSHAEVRSAGIARVAAITALIFAAQMVNFPVAGGTSGHLIGAALAVALVGPWTAVLMTAVLTVQALVFADGGVTALGTNVLLMGVVAVAVAAGIHVWLSKALQDRPGGRALTAFAAALLSVPAAALTFATLYAVAGVAPVPAAELFAHMLGWHLLIGVAEAAITAVLVVAFASARTRAIVATAVLVAAGFSLAASAHPDGLEHVAQTLGFAGLGVDSFTAASPLADYTVFGVDAWYGTAVAGAVGVTLTAAVMLALGRALPFTRSGQSG